jgi:hypothetical protein
MDEFGALRWVPSQPSHLNFLHAQILMIGESSGIKKAMEPQEEDMKKGKVDPADILEDLNDQDVERMEHLKGDASLAIYADLHTDAENYPKLQTTF